MQPPTSCSRMRALPEGKRSTSTPIVGRVRGIANGSGGGGRRNALLRAGRASATACATNLRSVVFPAPAGPTTSTMVSGAAGFVAPLPMLGKRAARLALRMDVRTALALPATRRRCASFAC